VTICFANTFRDRLAFAAYHLPRNPLMLLIMGGAYLFITISSVVPAARDEVAKKPEHAIILFISFIIVEALLAVFLIGVMACMTLLGMVSRKNKPFYARKTITFQDECFISESEYSRSEIRWKIVQKLARTTRHVFIYVNSESAVVIPRRAFESDSEWNVFYELCKNNVKRSKALPAA